MHVVPPRRHARVSSQCADARDNTEPAMIFLEDAANLRSCVPHQLLRLLQSLAQRPRATLLERPAGSFASPCSLCLYVFTPSSSLFACSTIFRKPEGSPCRVELRSETIEKSQSPVAIRRCNAGQNSFARPVPTSCSTAAGSVWALPFPLCTNFLFGAAGLALVAVRETLHSSRLPTVLM